ncbi:MAG: hypothetical protein QME74_03790, partial [Candidatus Edwardsbacteria bacterium]|nr:hypothetical protein [Candidatus Edwardsbacteria bacterium]
PRWPGDAPYLFGGKLFEYLAARNGRRSLAAYQKDHSRLLWPFLQSSVALDVYGAGFNTLWRQWRDQCYADFRKQIDSIRIAGGTEAKRLTATGYDKSDLAMSPDGRYLGWIEYNQHRFPSLQIYDVRRGAVRCIHEGYLAGSLYFSPDGREIVFCKREYVGSRDLYYDLYITDICGKKTRRLTRGMRAHDPAWSPDGRTILFVRDSLGANALATIDLRSGSVEFLTEYDAGSRYSHPSLSPDGTRAALSVWCEGGYHDIYILNLAAREFRPLLVDQAQDLCPVWSADGRSILFASDRTGVWNAFRCDLDMNRLYQLTNAIGGALYPVIDSGTNLYSLDLNANGFDLIRSAINSGEGWSAPPFVDSLPRDLPELTGTVYPSRPYHPLASMAPYFWFPASFADERGSALGLWVLGSDALLQKNYLLALGYNSRNGRPVYNFTITDASRPFAVMLHLSDLSMRHDAVVNAVGTAYWERQQTQELGVGYVHRRAAYQIAPMVSYRHHRLSGLNNVLPGFNPFWTGNLASLRLSCAFSNAKEYGWSISPEHGRSLYGETELYRKFLGSGISQTIAWGRWREYVNLPTAHHVVLLDGRAGAWKANGISNFEGNGAFDLRGYANGTLYQPYRACATVEYRFPLLRIERGYRTWPLYWKNVHGALFAEAGIQSSTAGALKAADTKRSFGGELRSDWLVSYALPGYILIGYARALKRPYRNSVYWMIGLKL